MYDPIRIKGRKIFFSKQKWHANDIYLAECLGFSNENNIISANLTCTHKRAIHEFIKQAYPEIDRGGHFKGYREALYLGLKNIYRDIFYEFVTKTQHKWPTHKRYKTSLFKHQKHDLLSISMKQYNLVAAEQGTGKTILCAMKSKLLNYDRTLIIATATAKWNWYHELSEEWGFNHLCFTVLDASKPKEIYAFKGMERFVLCNYEMVTKKIKYIAAGEIRHIIIDESHHIKNSKTKKWKGIDALRKMFPDAHITLATGTPVANRVNDMFAYLKLCQHPLGQNYSQFQRDYIRMGSAGKILGGTKLDDLYAKISNFMIRRTAAECMDLPPITISKCFFQLDEYKPEYDSIVDEMFNKQDMYDEFRRENAHILNRYDSLQIEISAYERAGDSDRVKEVREQIKEMNRDHHDIIKQAQDMALGLKSNTSLHSLNIITAKSKLKGIIEWAEEIIDSGKKVCLFSNYNSTLDLLSEHFKDRCVMIRGDVPSTKRMDLVHKFNNDEKFPIFLGNMKAAGESINLVGSQYLMTVDFPFTPAILSQVIKRLHRGGQLDKVFIFYSICEDSIDEDLYSLIGDKLEDINQLIDRGKEGAMDFKNIKDELFKKLLEKYKRKVVA